MANLATRLMMPIASAFICIYNMKVFAKRILTISILEVISVVMLTIAGMKVATDRRGWARELVTDWGGY
jgi:hypothetical protein